MVLMIISAHDSQRIFPQASLIILSVPPALVHRVLICVGWWGDSREGDQEVLAADSVDRQGGQSLIASSDCF